MIPLLGSERFERIVPFLVATLMLIDSNIMITAAKPGNLDLPRFLYSISRSVSVITYIVSFGFHSLSETEMSDLTEFLPFAKNCPSPTKSRIRPLPCGNSAAWASETLSSPLLQ